MIMSLNLTHFLTNESGAITVDWVVLSAAIVGMGVASVGAVRTGTASLGTEIEASLSGASVALLELNPYRFRTMTESEGFWNSIPGRRAQMAAHTDADLIYSFEYFGLHFFDDAIARGYNNPCDGCRGAGNRLDLMKIQVDEMAARGLATQEHYDILADAEARYVNAFGY
jgi:hypothetical protein